MAKLQFNRGSTSVAFLGMVVFLIALSIVLVSGAGYDPASYNNGEASPAPDSKSQIIVETPVPAGQQNLQLRTFGMITVAPSPTPAALHGCTQKDSFNDETIILLGSDPFPGGSIGKGKQVRLWVVDERAPKVAAGETLDATGKTIHGPQVGAKSGGPYPYIWEPSIYLTELPASPIKTLSTGRDLYMGDAENNGVPNYPDYIKGEYNNDPSSDSLILTAPQPIDPDYHLFENGPDYQGKPAITPIPAADKSEPRTRDWKYAAEYLWNVDNLQYNGAPLAAGKSYRAQIVVHDGDDNMGIDCITVSITN